MVVAAAPSPAVTTKNNRMLPNVPQGQTVQAENAWPGPRHLLQNRKVKKKKKIGRSESVVHFYGLKLKDSLIAELEIAKI